MQSGFIFLFKLVITLGCTIVATVFKALFTNYSRRWNFYMLSVYKEKYLTRAKGFSSSCLASLCKDDAEIKRRKVYIKTKCRWGKDCNGFVLIKPWSGRVEMASLFSFGNFSGHMTILSKYLLRLVRKALSLFRSPPDVYRWIPAKELTSFRGVRILRINMQILSQFCSSVQLRRNISQRFSYNARL